MKQTTSLRRVEAVREAGCWFIDDANGFNRWQNQLIEGAPEFLEHLVGPLVDRVEIEYSTEPFFGAYELEMVGPSDDGTTYVWDDNGRLRTLWLCPVLLYYFPVPPDFLYARVVALS